MMFTSVINYADWLARKLINSVTLKIVSNFVSVCARVFFFFVARINKPRK